MVFPLLNTPQLVIAEIINLLEPGELFTMSFCSKNALKIVKTYRKKSVKWDIWLSTGWYPKVLVDFPKLELPYTLLSVFAISQIHPNTKMININGHSVPGALSTSKKFMETFWEDTQLGIKTIFEYAFEILGQNDIGYVHIIKESMWIIDWINSRRMSVKVAQIGMNEVVEGNEFDHILRNCRPTEELLLAASPPENYRFSGNFASCSYEFRPAFWLTIDNLLEMNSTLIRIKKSKLTSLEMSRFLRHWMSGGSDQLKYLSIEIETVVMAEVLADLEDKFQLVREQRHYCLANDVKGTMTTCYDIQRDDGTIASFIWEPRNSHFEFQIFVWPDLNGHNCN